jgi:GTP cyclohydrolase I
MWHEFIDYDPGKLDTCFETTKADQLVVVSGMRVWSFCEHHLLPFWCDVSCGYTTDQNIIGLSKFARIAHKHAHSLQVQERLVEQMADDIQAMTKSENVGVVARGVHTCMVMRGIRTEGTMTSSAMRGAFRHNASMREEFLSLCRDR